MEDAVTENCYRCGNEAAGNFGDEAFCGTCYHAASFCCGLFGGES